jgi:hypothetical protein
MSAVSMKVPPASANRSNIAREASSSAPPPRAVPKFAVPSAYRDTRRPLARPKVVYRMALSPFRHRFS